MQYKANILGREVEVDLDFSVNSSISPEDGRTPVHRVNVSSFSVGEIQIQTVTTENAKTTLG